MSLGPTYPYSVEALVSQMERRQTSNNRFALPYTEEGTYSALLAAVKGEVAARNREFVMSEAVDDRLKKISAWLNDPKGRFGLMLGGTCGNGKTTFAKAIRKLFDDLQLRNCYNITVTARFLTSKDLLQMCVNAPDKWEEICLAPILIIDDLGEEPLEIERASATCSRR